MLSGKQMEIRRSPACGMDVTEGLHAKTSFDTFGSIIWAMSEKKDILPEIAIGQRTSE